MNLKFKSKKRKFGLVMFCIWFLVVVAFIFCLFLHPLVDYSDPLVDYSAIFDFFSLFAIIILFPVWAFLLGNKLMKVVSILPLGLIILGFLIYLFIGRPHKIYGESMEPNIIPDEYVVSERLSYYFSQPKRGDVIVFGTGSLSDDDFIDRIVGLPGEYISIHDGHVYINNMLLSEPYLTNDIQTESGPYIAESNVRIPDNEYAVLGDNRGNSNDSRAFGFIKNNSIIGKIFYIYWPANLSGYVKPEFPQLLSVFPEPTAFPKTLPSCQTLNTKMIIGADGRGQIGCDIKVRGKFDLSESYCEGQMTHTVKYLIPDAYGRLNRYYATLTGLDLNEEVKVFIYSTDGHEVECLPSLNKS
jgi:signal peptidase I